MKKLEQIYDLYQQIYDLYQAGYSAFEKKSYDDAIRKFQEAIALFCEVQNNQQLSDEFISLGARIYFDCAGAYSETATRDMARAYYEKSIKLLGQKRERNNGVLPDNEQTLRAEAHYNCGVASYTQKKWNIALVDLTEAIDDSKVLPEMRISALRNRSRVYIHLGNFDKALADCAIIAKEDPAEGYLASGYVRLKQGREKDLGEALEDETRAIDLLQTNSWRRALAHYDRSRIYNALGKPEEALQDVTQAIKLNPNKIDFFELRVKIYGALEKLDKEKIQQLQQPKTLQTQLTEQGASSSSTASKIVNQKGPVFSGTTPLDKAQQSGASSSTTQSSAKKPSNSGLGAGE